MKEEIGVSCGGRSVDESHANERLAGSGLQQNMAEDSFIPQDSGKFSCRSSLSL